ncbi:MAG: hypothetical protein RRY42_07875 [Mucinivorans sp.]
MDNLAAIQIQGINADDFFARLKSVVTPPPVAPSAPQELDTIAELTVDRRFVMRNLPCSQHKIFRYEDEGVLRPVVVTSDIKTVYYKFSDYLKMAEIEAAKRKKR